MVAVGLRTVQCVLQVFTGSNMDSELHARDGLVSHTAPAGGGDKISLWACGLEPELREGFNWFLAGSQNFSLGPTWND